MCGYTYNQCDTSENHGFNEGPLVVHGTLKPRNMFTDSSNSGRFTISKSCLDDLGVRSTPRFGYLKSLTLANCRFSCSEFTGAFAKMPKLRRLCLHDVLFTDRMLAMKNSLDRLAALTSQLDFLGLSDVPQTLYGVLAKTKVLPSHVYLSLSSRKCTPDLAEMMCQIVPKNTQFSLLLLLVPDRKTGLERLKSLSQILAAAGDRLKSIEIQARYQPLPIPYNHLFFNLTSLTQLKISGATELLNDGDLISLARMTPNLRVLHLGKSCLLLAEDYRSLWRYWNLLQELSLTRSQIQGVDLYALISQCPIEELFLMKCPNLDLRRRDLALDSSVYQMITDNCPQLRVLVIQHCRVFITQPLILHLLSSRPMVEFMNLEGQHVDVSPNFKDEILMKASDFSSSEVTVSGSVRCWKRQFSIIKSVVIVNRQKMTWYDKPGVNFACCSFCGLKAIHN